MGDRTCDAEPDEVHRDRQSGDVLLQGDVQRRVDLPQRSQLETDRHADNLPSWPKLMPHHHAPSVSPSSLVDAHGVSREPALLRYDDETPGRDSVRART